MTESIDCAIIGAGVVGLGVARALSMAGHETIILEAADAFGTGISSRNSEVIHAGIYYAPQSMKARLCVDGRKMLYEFCASHGVAYKRCAKLIVATMESDVHILDELAANAATNGVDDMLLLDGVAAKDLEPNLHCVAALLSPSTGIIDGHSLMLAMLGDAEEHGGVIACNSPVDGGEISNGKIILQTGGNDPMQLACNSVINCAGLQAQSVAQSINGVAPETIPKRYLAKGSYFYLAAPPPFSRLIYPVPTKASLGMHYTMDLAGQPRFGPDVEWIDDIEYSVDSSRAENFQDAISSYWPEITTEKLQPGYAGIRPKIQAPGESAADFCIQDQKTHGVKGLINLFGIESPGLTASLAIGDKVAKMLE